MYDLRVSKPSDIAYPIKSYKSITGEVVTGDFPILVKGVSQCCRENNGHIRSKTVIIPTSK